MVAGSPPAPSTPVRPGTGAHELGAGVSTRIGRGRVPGAPRALASLVLALALGVVAAGCSLIGGSSGVAQVSVFHLAVGQCLVPPKKVQASLSTVEVVPCSTPHPQQVYALVHDHGGSAYPASSKLDDFANAACLDRFSAFVGIPYRESSLYFTYLLPSVGSWADGDRTIVCVAETVGRPLTKSLKGSRI